MRRVLAILLVVLSSGCALNAPQDAPTATPTATQPTVPDTADELVVPPTEKSQLPVSLSVQDRWVRPSDLVVANATAPAGATIGWFLAPRNPDVPGEENYEFVPRTLAATPPGSTSNEARMAELGRYTYAARAFPNASFNVTVVSALPAGAGATVSFVVDEYGPRFFPTELFVGKNAPVRVHNRAKTQDVEPVRVEQMTRVGADGPAVSFRPPVLLGDYDLVALARDDADGWGQASARIIVDARKPDANVTLGPWSGTFTVTTVEKPDDFPISTRFNLSSLTLAFNAASSGPQAASVRVSVIDANGTVLGKAEGAQGTLELRELPGKSLVVRVESLAGVSTSYQIEGKGVMGLVAPDSFFNK